MNGHQLIVAVENKLRTLDSWEERQAMGGNEFWQALNTGDIPDSMQEAYEKAKREARRMFQHLYAA